MVQENIWFLPFYQTKPWCVRRSNPQSRRALRATERPDGHDRTGSGLNGAKLSASFVDVSLSSATNDETTKGLNLAPFGSGFGV